MTPPARSSDARPRPGRLGPAERAASFARFGRETFDVVVVGGGSTGAGCALDAVTRGLSVALVEARDWAAGTSSRSSKLIHGGLRYLEQRELHLVREALRERSLLLNLIAPHLVRPVSFLYPLRHRLWERAYVGAGMLLYDELGGHEGLRRHRHLTRRGALKLAPALARDALIGAVQYDDCQVDDARHTLNVVRTAARYGAAVAGAASVVGFLREAGRVTGVAVLDHTSGERVEIRARVVINATGVWTDELQQLVGERGKFNVTASKGVHLVVPRDRLQLDTGLILRTERSVLFVIPWGRHWLIGTTDTEWRLDKAHPAASRADIDYVLERCNAVLAQPLGREDVQGVFAGLRPLLSGESEDTSRLSREHSVAVPVPGLVAVAGGKYTTYRVMARDAIDAAVRAFDRGAPASVTATTPLLGADGFRALWNGRHRLAEDSGLHVARIEHLLGRYGSLAHELLELLRERPELAEPLPGADSYMAVEALYAAMAEGALHVDDVLARRTRISIESWDRGEAAAEPVAELMAGVLGWSSEETAREVAYYHARVAAERRSQEQDDDRAADAARLMAPDVLAGAQGGGAVPRAS
ncbi:MAG TPA: glycerol-3-phosphate dehydrogenase/oxidase [Solirubrobacteraceae bacterium]|nr:glycerol-3-phosphate dehydrogenase/oxidase [Solirubrobacteraceae bacterium]